MNDKNHSMLLTIVAVATLLVAVVGASFAFFGLAVTDSASKTASVSGSVGSNVNNLSQIMAAQFAVSTENTSLVLNPTAANMSTSNTNTYHATLNGNPTTSSNPINIFKVQLSSGYAGQQYKCTIGFTVAKNASDTMISVLPTNDDLKITLNSTGASDTLVNSSSTSVKNIAQTLYGLTTTGNSYTATLFITGASGTSYITADIALANRNANQNALIGTSLKVDITRTSVNCEPVL